MCKIYKPVIDVALTAANIKSFRLRSGYSVKQIQTIFNFEYPQAIYNWESGKDIPSIDNLLVISSIYNVAIDELIIRKNVEIELKCKV